MRTHDYHGEDINEFGINSLFLMKNYRQPLPVR